MSEPYRPSLAAELEALNDAVRRGHELLADMRAERKLMAEQLAAARRELRDGVEKVLEAEVERQIGALTVVTRKAMDDTIIKVEKEIQGYLELSLGQDAYSKILGRLPLPEAIAEARKVGKLDV